MAVILVICGARTAPADMRSDLDALIKASGGNRTAGRPGSAKAYAWLKAQAEKIGGWEVVEHKFKPDIDFSVKNYKWDYEKYIESGIDPNHPEVKKVKGFTDRAIAYQESLRGKTGMNLILRKKGTNKKRANQVVLVSAHYDTITHNHDTLEVTPDKSAPGADDNGAAVVAALQLARELKDLKPAVTFEIVFFDFEEAFFLGSHAYAKELRGKGVDAKILNLEMIGWNKPTPGLVKVYCRTLGHPGGKVDIEIARAAHKELEKAGLKPLILRNDFNRSDNWTFWEQAHFGITITQDWERNFNKNHYHTSNDTPDTVDWKFVEKIKTATGRLARAMVR